MAESHGSLGVFVSLLILKNIFGAATMLLFTIIVYLYATKKPDILSVVIDKKGVSINDTTISYSTISSFWILYEPPVKDLILIRKEKFTPKTIIPIGDINPVELRNILLENAVEEKEEEESFVDIIARKLGF